MVLRRRWPSLEAAISDYLAVRLRHHEQGALEWGSFRSIRNALRPFLTHIEPPDEAKLPPLQIDQGHVTDWWQAMIDRGHAVSTVKRWSREVVTFLEWVGHPDAREIRRLWIRKPERATRTYNDAELQAVFDWIGQNSSSEDDRRMEAAVFAAILCTSGIRIREASELRWDQWERTECRFDLTTHTKTSEQRWALVDVSYRDIVEAWRARIGGLTWLFPSSKDNRRHSTPKHLRQLLTELIAPEAEVANLQARRFRTKVAELLDRGGADTRHAAAVLGHKSTQTFDRYYRRITPMCHTITAHRGAMAVADEIRTSGEEE